ncbi:hypothetical protein Dimus_003467 [Dionaea muscipula]
MMMMKPQLKKLMRKKKGLLGSSHERCYSRYGSLDPFIRGRLSAEQQAEICREVSDAEVAAMFKSLKKDKAPGPDGLAPSSVRWMQESLMELWLSDL